MVYVGAYCHSLESLKRHRIWPGHYFHMKTLNWDFYLAPELDKWSINYPQNHRFVAYITAPITLSGDHKMQNWEVQNTELQCRNFGAKFDRPTDRSGNLGKVSSMSEQKPSKTNLANFAALLNGLQMAPKQIRFGIKVPGKAECVRWDEGSCSRWLGPTKNLTPILQLHSQSDTTIATDSLSKPACNTSELLSTSDSHSYLLSELSTQGICYMIAKSDFATKQGEGKRLNLERWLSGISNIAFPHVWRSKAITLRQVTSTAIRKKLILSVWTSLCAAVVSHRVWWKWPP